MVINVKKTIFRCRCRIRLCTKYLDHTGLKIIICQLNMDNEIREMECPGKK